MKQFYTKNENINNKKLKSFVLNFGPQHPAAHGILKISLEMSGETIINSDSQFGLLHRGVEKIVENRNWVQNIPYMDRFDYVANILQEHAYCLAVENSSKDYNNYNWFYARMRACLDEFSRVLNHLLTLSAVSLDLGAMGPIFWAFEEREGIMMFYEKISGARMHTALYKPFSQNLTWWNTKTFKYLVHLLFRSGRSIKLSFLSLLNNKALKSRLSLVGGLSKKKN